MALTHSSETQSSRQGTTAPMPPPQLFDILPPLHEILARLDHASPANDSSVQQEDRSSAELGASYNGLRPLEPKDLPTAILPLKAQLRRGLKELEKLPDMERTVQEQEQEIAELEERLRRQREMLDRLGNMARSLEGDLGIGGG